MTKRLIASVVALLPLLAFAGSPASADQYITNYGSSYGSMVQYCVGKGYPAISGYSSGYVVRKDAYATTQLYSQRIYTNVYITSRNPRFANPDPSIGQYFCFYEVIKAGWKDADAANAPAAKLPPANGSAITSLGPTYGQKATAQQAASFCTPDAAVWVLAQKSKDMQAILLGKHQTNWNYTFYVKQGESGYGDPAYGRTGTAYQAPNYFECYKIMLANARGLVQDDIVYQQMIQAPRPTAAPYRPAGSSSSGGLAITNVHFLNGLPSSTGGFTVVGANGEAWVSRPNDTYLRTDAQNQVTGLQLGGQYGPTFPLLASNGGKIVATGAGNLITDNGGAIIVRTPSGGTVVASGAGNIVSHDGGTFRFNGTNLIGQDGAGFQRAYLALTASGGGSLISAHGGKLITDNGGALISLATSTMEFVPNADSLASLGAASFSPYRIADAEHATIYRRKTDVPTNLPCSLVFALKTKQWATSAQSTQILGYGCLADLQSHGWKQKM